MAKRPAVPGCDAHVKKRPPGRAAKWDSLSKRLRRRQPWCLECGDELEADLSPAIQDLREELARARADEDSWGVLIENLKNETAAISRAVTAMKASLESLGIWGTCACP